MQWLLEHRELLASCLHSTSPLKNIHVRVKIVFCFYLIAI